MPRKPKGSNLRKCSRPPPSPPRTEVTEEAGETDPILIDSLIGTDRIFDEGALVEVSSDEEGFHGAWFAATVVKSVGKDKFLIEYKDLRTEDDSAFLREEVDILHLRPHPPKNVVDRFKQLDEVDALHNDGWWVGVVSKVLRGSRYIVYFRETCEELEYQQSDLRLHQDWIDGKWVIPSLHSAEELSSIASAKQNAVRAYAPMEEERKPHFEEFLTHLRNSSPI